jgi:hypothetical protein
VKLVSAIRRRLRWRKKTLEEKAQDQAAAERFFLERQANEVDYRDWPER